MDGSEKDGEAFFWVLDGSFVPPFAAWMEVRKTGERSSGLLMDFVAGGKWRSVCMVECDLKDKEQENGIGFR